MNLLPVAERELRLLARRPRTYRMRDLTALIVIGISVGMLYAGFGGALRPASAGRNLFTLLSCVAAVYVLIEGALLTADCLSSEKRAGTLGLLFLTDLKGYDVVAGKLISQTANSVYGLLAALPALAIALFLGSVTGRDVLRMALALLNGLFFAACLGMLISACCRQERRVLSLAFFGMLLWAGLVPFAGWGLSVWRQTGPIPSLFLIWSPAGAFLHALQPGNSGGGFTFTFAESLAWTHGLAWAFLVAASVILPHAVREEAVAQAPALGPRRCGPHLRSGRSETLSRADEAELNPLIRAGDRPGQRGLGMWPVVVVFVVSWVAGWAVIRSAWLVLPIFIGTVLLLHLCLCYFVTLQACRGPGDDQRSGVLEILLTTPLGDDAYLTGRMLSLKRQCLWPVLLVLTVDLGLTTAGCLDPGTKSWAWLWWVVAFVVLATRLLVDLYTLSWVGVWQGLKSGDTGRAMRKTFYQVFLVRWLVFLGFMGLVSALTLGRVFQTPAGLVIAAAMYLAFPLASLQHLCQAMSELKDDLRTLALGRDAEEERAGWVRFSGFNWLGGRKVAGRWGGWAVGRSGREAVGP